MGANPVATTDEKRSLDSGARAKGDRVAERYRLLKMLGEGSSAQVWLAEDLASNSRVALKILLSDAPLMAGPLKDEFSRLARIDHPNVVRAHDFGVLEDGSPYFTMEWIDGNALTESITSGELEELVPLLEGASAGLEAIHAAGLAHGDVKPANILIADGRPVIPDLVKLVDLSLAVARAGGGRPSGTPGFAAPEVVAGEPASPSADLYGLGAAFYTALAGRAPFTGHNIEAILRAQREQEPSALPLKAAGVSPDIVQLVLRLLARDPGQRPGSAAETREIIADIGTQGSKRRPPAPALRLGSWVGRSREISKVESKISRGGLPVLVTGRPGIGRSRFLRELGLRLELEGGSAVTVSCRGRSDAAEEWLRRISLLTGSEHGSPLAQLLSEAAQRSRSLLVLEDLHAGNDADIDLARQLLVTRTPPGVLVLLSWAESSPARSRAFEDLTFMARGPWLEESPLSLDLSPLSREDSDLLTRSLLAVEEMPVLEEALWRLSGGVPAWIEGGTRALIEQGALLRDADSWRIAPDADLSAPLPALERIHAGRIATLSSGARHWMAAIAYLGGEAPAGVIREISDEGESAEAETLQSTLASLEMRDGDSWVRLDPPSIGETILRSLRPEERKQLCTRAAERLQNQPVRAAELWLEAGVADRALDALPTEGDHGLSSESVWRRAHVRLRAHEVRRDLSAAHLREGAQAAQGAFHMREAATLWERFSSLSKDGDDILGAAEGKIEAAECLRWLAEHVQTSLLLDEAEGLIDESFVTGNDLVAELRSRILSERSWLALTRGEMAAAEELAKRARDLAPEEALGARFTAWNRLAAIYQQAGKLEEAEQAVTEGLRLAREWGDEVAEARINGNAAVIAGMRGDRRTELERWKASIALAERAGWLNLAARGRTNLIPHLARHARVEQLRLGLREAEEALRASGSPESLFLVLHEAARLEFRLGNLKRAHALTTGRFLRKNSSDRESMTGWAWNRLGMIHALWGRMPSAARMYRHAMRVWRKGVLGEAVGYTLANTGELALEAGQIRRASRLFERAARESREFPSTAAWVVRPRLQLAVRTRDVEGGRRALAEAPTLESVADDPQSEGNILEALAHQAWIEGDTSAAIHRWRQAEQLYREREYPLARARSLAAGGAALAGLPMRTHEQSELALSWLTEARGFYERIGAHGPLLPLLSHLNRLQEEIRQASGPVSTADHPETLYEVSHILNSILDFPELLQRTLTIVCKRLSAERGLIVLVDPETSDLSLVARYGDFDDDGQADALQVSTSIVRRVAQSGSTLRSDDALLDPRLSTVKSVFDLSLRSVLCVALRLRDEVIGTIYLQNRSASGAFTDRDIAFLESFSNLVAVAIENSRLHDSLRRSNEVLIDENANLRQEVTDRFIYGHLVGRSPQMSRVQSLIDRFARTSVDVLIQGETGTGKEMVAKTIHFNSPRRDKPFVSFNCVGSPESLIERELFGIEPHTATGVHFGQGVFERAEGGTLLLDEIGDMPVAMQPKLLRVIQEREFTRVGGKRPIPVNLTIIAATNVDLLERVKAERFRADLYYRVARLMIPLPPLRERKGDVAVLARHFVEEYCQRFDRKPPKLSSRLLAVLAKSQWPGNVRELQHYIERLLVMSDESVLEPLVLPSDLEEREGTAVRPVSLAALDGIGSASLDEAISSFQRQLIQAALDRCAGNQSKAAKLLGLREATLRYRLRVLGIRA